MKNSLIRKIKKCMFKTGGYDLEFQLEFGPFGTSTWNFMY